MSLQVRQGPRIGIPGCSLQGRSQRPFGQGRPCAVAMDSGHAETLTNRIPSSDGRSASRARVGMARWFEVMTDAAFGLMGASPMASHRQLVPGHIDR